MWYNEHVLPGSDEVMIGRSHVARKSARMIKPKTYVVLDNKTRKIETKVIEDDGTVVLTDTDGHVFRRPGGAKIEIA